MAHLNVTETAGGGINRDEWLQKAKLPELKEKFAADDIEIEVLCYDKYYGHTSYIDQIASDKMTSA